ncbi:class II aldolase/adducin family protein [Prochlorococcus sp. MIT 1300]|uniref:class II aldolase/adducin family protein n=1 Tax=Prochlorococcus sp. MIT 1300 TaxID=3096218 RepID=UPI002A766163|nr:class II aldolase/adducin family protein [Prochlorococcus sp. MIT 1300]
MREEIVDMARRINALGLNQGASGNIACRTPAGMLVTPSAKPYETMSPSDVLEISLSGSIISRPTDEKSRKTLRPSSEWRLHAHILSERPEVNSVLHCHSAFATAIACHGRDIPSFHYMIAIAGGNNIRCAPYQTFGTEELSSVAVKALKDRFACLLAHHGQVALGKTLNQALNIALEVESLSKVYLNSLIIGEPKKLSDVEMKRVLDKINSIGYSTDNQTLL